ncbi:MAG: prenyltransferase/squalene oxidase repeat-containing protein [Chitinophagaceae bacterium]
MKLFFSKRNTLLSASALAVAALLAGTTISKDANGEREIKCCNNPNASHVCIMKTILGIDTSQDGKLISTFKTPEKVEASIKKGLEWMGKAQSPDGGWGAGTHSRQDVLDPHAVTSDPATTALVAMSLLRTDNTLEKGDYSKNLKKSTEFLLKAVEDCPENQPYITLLTNTQPQIKLGRNIDVILTAQFFTNILRYNINDDQLKKRIEKALDKCVARIQKGQDSDGSWRDGGWAPVLQSALANNALESADDVGRKVDKDVMERSRKYQNGNFDVNTNSVVTGKAAGVMLYGLSSTTRASAKESKRAQDMVEKAKREGKIKSTEVNEENLKAAGATTTDAKELVTAYSINKASQQQAQREDVLTGFGNNGGEEFMSFLMTGESLLMQGGDSWKKWYDGTTGKLVNIQNGDGSWNGHHCITSPVFCTATCLLILSIHNDMQFSIQQHPKSNN